MFEFKRSRHSLVWQVLEALDADVLRATRCYFGGGTRIVLALNEYRESLDVDFLCASRAGYRDLRSMITQASFGGLFRGKVALLREIRADMYGVRTFLEVDGQPVKFEIISEGRIDLAGEHVEPFPVELLSQTSCFAEKFMANADRGHDESTRSRDIIDLAFMAAHWPSESLSKGLATAVAAYGEAVHRGLDIALEKFDDRSYRNLCTTELSVSEIPTMRRGLRSLRNLSETR